MVLPGAERCGARNQRSRLLLERGSRRTVAPAQSGRFVFENTAIFHNETHALQFLYIFNRVAGNGNHVSIGPRSNHANLALRIEHVCGAGCRRSYGVHRRHAKLDHTPEFLGNGIIPWKTSRISPEDDFDAGVKSFRKRRTVDGDAFAVAFTLGSILARPPVVIRRKSGAIPGALANHLGDSRLVELESMVD